MKKYAKIWIKNTPELYTWHTEEQISEGSLVEVSFRNQKKQGIVMEYEEKNKTIKTKEIEKIKEENFISKEFIQFLKKIGTENGVSLTKMLSISIPENFLYKKNFLEKETWYEQKTEIKIGKSGKKEKIKDHFEKNQRLTQKEIQKQKWQPIIKELEEKGSIIKKEGLLKAFFQAQPTERKKITLTEKQKEAQEKIEKSTKPILLHGITGSGKTEIYKNQIKKTKRETPNAQVLYLLPEIAITTPFIKEFENEFGEIAVMHSNLTEKEKTQEWERIRTGEAKILIGTRSAIFTPFKDLKLIIVDEEHEWTYKNEFAPRYQIHDVLEFWEEKNVKIIYGSATPRLESLEKTKNKKWELVTLLEKVHQTKLPEIELIDLKNERKKGNKSLLSERLEQSIHQCLKNKKQIILFLNQRGFSGSTFCEKCGNKFECPNCSSPMKMHKKDTNEKFLCHICGHMEEFPKKCPSCKNTQFLFRSEGTQSLEKTIKEKFPTARVLRADADTIGGKRYAFEKILTQMENQETDILIGTQMISKGLDLENVQLAGIILADIGLNLPDFRAEERIFQLLTQVAGRAGRQKETGEIIIQTFNPNDFVLQCIQKNDFEKFKTETEKKRQTLNFPPFCTLAKITFSNTDKTKAFTSAKKLFQEIQAPNIQKYIAPAFFPKTHGKFHFHILIKSSNKETLLKIQEKHKTEGKWDINPISLL